MNEELMTNDEIEVVGEPEEVMDERSGMPTGLAMLIGGGITLAVVAGVKKVKKLLANRKAKKAEEENTVEESKEESKSEEKESKSK